MTAFPMFKAKDKLTQNGQKFPLLVNALEWWLIQDWFNQVLNNHILDDEKMKKMQLNYEDHILFRTSGIVSVGQSL